MIKDYDSRQRKIYNDYNAYTTESLLEILNKSNEYYPEVIEVIKDILSERNVITSSEAMEAERYHNTDADREVENAEAVLFSEDRRRREETVKSFVKKLIEKTGDELAAIITRYIDYQPETVEAALYVSVEKGIISYDLKEILLRQIESNFADHRKRFKQYKWESNNAFIGYVSRYTDDEIFNILEDPGDIVIDVYHAVLLTARQRELITDENFAEYYAEAKRVPKTRTEIRNEVIDEFIEKNFIDNEPVSEAEVDAEAEKYWKCPSCSQMVSMELGVCWNCQAEIPETIVHPDKKEIIKEIRVRRSFNPVKTGFILIGCGAVIDLLCLARGYSFDDYWHFRYLEFLLGIIGIIAGAGFIIFGLFFKPKDKD